MCESFFFTVLTSWVTELKWILDLICSLEKSDKQSLY